MWLAVIIVVLIAMGAMYYLFGNKPALKPIKGARTIPQKVVTKRTGKKYLVVGGNGFLGSHLVEALLARGETNITILDIVPSHLFDPEVADGRVRFIKGDLCSLSSIQETFKGIDSVFHTAAILEFWKRLPHQKARFQTINVGGTRNVIEACKREGVRSLHYVSSSTAVLTNNIHLNPIDNKNEEELGYTNGPHLCHYTESKQRAEQDVLAANGTSYEGKQPLATDAIRPNGVFGPRDEWIGRRRLLADTRCFDVPLAKQDYIYVENVVHALLLADDKVNSPKDEAAGHAFFVNSENPAIGYMQWNKELAEVYGHEFLTAPTKVLNGLAIVAEWITHISGGRISLGDLDWLTPPVMHLTSAIIIFSDEKARRILGYKPLYNTKEAMLLTAAYFQPERKDELMKQYSAISAK